MPSRNIPETDTEQLRENLNRATQIKRDEKELVQDPSSTLLGVDSAILWTLKNTLRPTVVDNGEEINVPVIWANAERWTSVQSQGYLRDAKGKLLVPLILLNRTTMTPYENLPNNKLTTELQTTVVKKYSSKNVYDRFSVLNGIAPTEEIYSVTMPDYFEIQYDVVIWCEYIEQVNRLTELFAFYEGKAWGDPDIKQKSFVKATAFDFAEEITVGADRLVRTTVTLDTIAHLIPKFASDKINKEKNFSVQNVSVNFGNEKGLTID